MMHSNSYVQRRKWWFGGADKTDDADAADWTGASASRI